MQAISAPGSEANVASIPRRRCCQRDQHRDPCGAATSLMVAHTLEVLVWAMIYATVGAAPADSDLLYFAFVNYTTLGYGDITPVQAWRLIGPMTAMNGILTFGWSTAVLFEVLRKTLDSLASVGAPGISSEDRGLRAASDPEARSGADWS